MAPTGRTARPIAVRAARPADREDWLRLRFALWPDSLHGHATEIDEHFAQRPDGVECLVAEIDGVIVGFAEVGLRAYAEACSTSPVGYLEGIYVIDGERGRGVGRALVAAGEQWARAKGCTEMASDRELANEASGLFHEALGYEEVERIVCFRKVL
jgi:aminoglycoside 6'-N-acetyltransferase I